MMPIHLTDHVALVLFLWVLGNQGGVPIPVGPPLLAAGALAHGRLELVTILAVGVGAALCADVAWYCVGRWHGVRALGPLRRRSTWAGAWIDRVANLPRAHEVVLLMGVRFLPELNPLAAGLAGATRVTLGRYLSCSAGTALVWAGTWTGLGYLLGAVIAGYLP
jgi:membrane protein DedA with SNARE-associated domain